MFEDCIVTDDNLLELCKHYAIVGEILETKNFARELGFGVKIATSVSSKTAFFGLPNTMIHLIQIMTLTYNLAFWQDNFCLMPNFTFY